MRINIKITFIITVFKVVSAILSEISRNFSGDDLAVFVVKCVTPENKFQLPK